MTDAERRLVMDYMVRGNNIGETDVFTAVDILSELNGNDIISVIIDHKSEIRPIVTGEIPQFSEEKDVNNVLRVLIDSGLKDLIYTINYKPDKDGKCEGELKDEGVSCGSDDGTVREDDE